LLKPAEIVNPLVQRRCMAGLPKPECNPATSEQGEATTKAAHVPTLAF